MDLGRAMREQVRRAVENAKERSDETKDSSATSVNVACAVNVGTSGHTMSVYSDGRVTIIQRDGETQVIRHRDEDDTEQG